MLMVMGVSEGEMYHDVASSPQLSLRPFTKMKKMQKTIPEHFSFPRLFGSDTEEERRMRGDERVI